MLDEQRAEQLRASDEYPLNSDTPERNMWQAFLERKVSDAQGRDGAYKETCRDCHFDNLHCGCRSVRLERKDIHVSKDNPDLSYFTIGWKRTIAATDAIAQFPDGFFYYRVLRPVCSGAHTYQQCAIDWIKSSDCEFVCGELDLSVDCFRRKAGVVQ